MLTVYSDEEKKEWPLKDKTALRDFFIKYTFF